MSAPSPPLRKVQQANKRSGRKEKPMKTKKSRNLMRKDPENENQKEIELCRCSFGCHFKSDSTIEQDEKEQIE
jgi:hypothetical protein